MKSPVEIFLDSGAYSAHKRGIKPIILKEYINYVRICRESVAIYANLDVIGDAEKTSDNQRVMEADGLKPLPCFHFGEDWEYLTNYINRYTYIALGGIADKRGKERRDWLDECFKMICYKKGNSRIKIHGFGITDVELLWRYPWYSVDSTAWIEFSSNGSIAIPKLMNDEYDYKQKPWVISVSSTSSLGKKNKHILNISGDLKTYCLNYIAQKGFRLGKSIFKHVDKDYRIKKGERLNEWADRDGKVGVEIIVERGICNDRQQIHELNAIYFADLEKCLTANPPLFQIIRG